MGALPKYREIYRILTDEIAQGVFAAGEKLPSEHTLALRFGVTRQTVLKALDTLKHDRLITAERGRGTFVAVTQGARHSNASERRVYFIGSSLEDSFGARLLLGVERAARRAGYSLVTCNSRRDADREAESLRRARNTGADGILLVPELGRPNVQLAARVAAEIPLVFLDNPLEGVNAPLVASDHFQAAYHAVNTLIRMGHRKIGMIVSLRELFAIPGAVADRYRAYRQALLDAGLPFREEWVQELGQTLSRFRAGEIGLDLYGYPAMHRMMNCDEVPTAVVLLWDELAPGALAAIRDGKKRVPEDFSLLGFNDDDLCSCLVPPLSSVSQPAGELAEKAFAILLRRMAGEPIPRSRILLPNRLVLRESIRALKVPASPAATPLNHPESRRSPPDDS